jgi:hypothetical protein
MFSLYAVHRALASERARHAARRLAAEFAAVLNALAHPVQFTARVEAMRSLHLEAERLEPTQPARAQRLRRQAALALS